jgi:putative ABC transport system permease protein
LVLAALAVAFPVATLAATLLYVDDSSGAMTRVALRPVQVEMRALATSLDADMNQVQQRLHTVPGVRSVERFGSANVVVSAPGAAGRVSARLFAVDPSYLAAHPWVHAGGDVTRGVLLNPAVASAPGFAGATSVSIDLRGDAPPLGLSLPVAGQADLRGATTWFEIPSGDVQGDIAVIPRAVVIDFPTFERVVLPALRSALGRATAVTNPGLTELPPASLEAHVAVDHGAYPADPSRAGLWSAALRRVLERRAPGDVIVADNAAERLTEAATDATNAKVLFLLLGIPGVLVAGALGLAAASAVADAHRREDALLRLRGAGETQLVRLAVGQGAVAGVLGTALGLGVAGAAVSSVIGHPVWRDIPPGRLMVTALAAALAATLASAARLVPLVRAGRRSALALERRTLAPATPTRRRLDLLALGVGLAVLVANLIIGGLKPTPVEGQTLALSFYVLLAPLALWVGVTLLAVRGLLAVLSRWSRPETVRPLTSWGSTAVRWLGRRPTRTAAALVLGALAVSFGVETATFVSTYGSAKATDTRAAFGADLRFLPATESAPPLPPLGPDIVATTPIRSIPARAGSDRKTIMALEPGSYRSATAIAPQMVAGGGLDALSREPSGVLVASELAGLFALQPGDTLPVTVFPDDLDLSQKLNLRVVGVFRAFPPTDPLSELVVSTRALPAPLPPPDFYLARLAGGHNPDQTAAALRRTGTPAGFSVTTLRERVRLQQRSLTALNLDGLSRIEITATALIAAIGVGVLGAFLVLERRREFAVLRTVGAGTRQTLTGPALEGALAVGGSLAIGVPVGLGLGVLSVRVLGLFFTLPPPLARVPLLGIAALSLLVVGISSLTLGAALDQARRLEVGAVLREP